MAHVQNEFSELARKWPAPIVARSEVGRFSGGLLNPRTLANHDSAGTGPVGKISMGRKIAYTVDSLVEWMAQRARGQKK